MLIATAGHVDHGKTTLIRALTGIDTDKLPDEKKRGLTIDLGFAYINTASGRRVGFIDVPGHEKFIRNMAAGVGGIDHALLVVAADDGVMPQTREHISILELLGVRSCIIVITRIDLVESSRVSTVADEVQSLLSATALIPFDCVAVNAIDGAGIEDLHCSLEKLEPVQSSKTTECFRLPVDRSFSIKGSGTVVTGSVRSGSISEGDSVLVLPAGRSARIRSLHVNGEPASMAGAGQRAALNLNAISAADIDRGHWVAVPAMASTTSCLDVKLRLLDGETRSLRHWQQVKVHAGAAVCSARVALFDTRELSAGQQVFAQLVLAQPQHLLFGDRFILRDHSATQTIGGGRVIDPFASRHRSYRKQRLRLLPALSQSDHKRALLDILELSTTGLIAEQFRLARNLSYAEFDRLIASEAISQIKTGSDTTLLSTKQLHAAQDTLLQTLAAYHLEHPHSAALRFNTLGASLGLHPNVLNAAADRLVKSGSIERIAGNRLRMPGFSPVLEQDDQTRLKALEKHLTPDLLKPPAASVLAECLNMERKAYEKAMAILVEYGAFIQVAHNRIYHPQAIQTLEEMARVLSNKSSEQGFTAREFAEHSGIGRNLTIDVLEYFDRIAVTKILDQQTKNRIARSNGNS